MTVPSEISFSLPMTLMRRSPFSTSPPIFAPARMTQPSAMIALRMDAPFSITTSGIITLSMTSAPLPTVQPVEMTECSIMP